MAVKSTDVTCDKVSSNSQGSSKCYKNSNEPANRLVQFDLSKEGSLSSLVRKYGKGKKYVDLKSPYYNGDSVHLLSRVIEKRYVHKKASNIVSSFPLAAKLYKASSDDFKALRNKKKVQKSVLTLPNEPAPVPQICTVSDMNDSEYFNRDDDNRVKTKKRIPHARTRKNRCRGKALEFYDRDAQFCSQLDINIDCSSTDTIKKYVDGEKKQFKTVSSKRHKDSMPHDVWTALRNINRFQFRPSPPLSDESYAPIRSPKRLNNLKDMRVIESCCTEEIAYISRYEVEDDTNKEFVRQSRSSSFDKITVIENNSDVNIISNSFDERIRNKNKSDRSPRTHKANCNKSSRCTYKSPQLIKKDVFHYQKFNSENRVEPVDIACAINTRDHYAVMPTAAKAQNLPQCKRQEKYNERNHNLCSQHEYNNSDSSDGCKAYNNKNKDKRRLTNLHLDELNRQVNDSTNDVFSKGDLHINKHLTSKKRPLHIPAKTSNHIIKPKLSNVDIKRRLLKNYKFPIVILGKDQLSSAAYEVIDEELSQLNGLNDQIWPYMMDWYPNNSFKKHMNVSEAYNNRNKKRNKRDEVVNIVQPKRSFSPKLVKLKPQPIPVVNKNKVVQKRVPVPLANILERTEVKPTPMQQIRDRILKLLYRNSLTSNSAESNKMNNTKDDTNSIIKVNICKVKANGYSSDVKSDTTSKLKSSTPVVKRPWAKAKWASDFIENVIRKIKAGVYYTYDNIVIKELNECDDSVENQSVSNCELHAQSTSNEDVCVKIPGFDIALPAVEITTMTMNEISIKHCVTNILVRFDVTAPKEPLVRVQSSTSFIPLSVSSNETKVFQCKTSIMNAILPAELCSLLPKMLRSIIETNEKLALPPIKPDKISSHLTTISEVTRCESAAKILSICKSSSSYKPKSKELWLLENGMYKNFDIISPKLHILQTSSLIFKHGQSPLAEELITKLMRCHLFDCVVEPLMHLIEKPEHLIEEQIVTPKHEINQCRALIPYTGPTLNLFYLDNNITSNAVPVLQTNYIFENAINISISKWLPHYIHFGNIVMANIGSLNFNLKNCITDSTSIKSIINCLNKPTDAISRCIKYRDISCSHDSPLVNTKNIKPEVSLPSVSNKIRRRGFLKLYKRRNSTSNISGEKSTHLSKVTSVYDFFQILGPGKLMSSILDSQSERKLMSSVKLIKNWTTEINSRQALLVLLLTNKKETLNLLRYKEMLLQGIAVNRITKAAELDMEIEVIEREKVNKFPQFEGITYEPAPVVNEDNLFDELCWIAKTTASDYQKPFDESSERLLKSLLQKRKKLNPSYLRVMARYVGLGLLHSPKKLVK